MITISMYDINSYVSRFTDLYPYNLTLQEHCQAFIDDLKKAGSQVSDNLMICDPTIPVSSTISNTAIYFACIELFGVAPGDIKTVGDKKIFTLSSQGGE